MKSHPLKITLLAAVSAFTLPAAVNATSCFNGTIKGTYAVMVSGVQGTAAPFDYVNAVRTAVFDGQGTFTGAGYQSINGQVTSFTTAGTYTVTEDCTVTITGIISGNVQNLQFGVIADKGRKIFAIRTDPGRNFSILYEAQ